MIIKEVSFHITDIAHNSIKANASRIYIEICDNDDMITFRIKDNGCGMDKKTLKMVIEQDFTSITEKKSGLGLPFLIYNAKKFNGDVSINSKLGVGSEVYAKFIKTDKNTILMGNISETLAQLITGNPKVNIIIKVIDKHSVFEICSKDFKDILKEIPIGHPKIHVIIKDIIQNNIFKKELN